MKRAILLAAFASAAFAQQPSELLAKIAPYEFGQSREPLVRFTRMVEDSLGSPARLKSIEASLLAFLDSAATPAAKDFALRELSLIATGASVPVLAALLVRPDTADLAHYALARIPARAADDALRAAIPRTSGAVRVAIIQSLGRRGDPRSVPALKALLASADSEAAGAAASALASIGDPAAVAALSEARAKAQGAFRLRLTEAYLETRAPRAYRELAAGGEPLKIRIGALKGLSEIDPRAAAPLLLAAIDSGDVKLQSSAMRLLSVIPGAEVTQALLHRFPKLAPAAQVRLLAALADRGDPAALPLFTETARTADGALRAAAFDGLGRIGAASTVPLLAEAGAREALWSLNAPGVDQAIVAALGSATGKVRVELIMAAGERGIAAASDLLIAAVQGKDPEVHREALRALRNVAGPGQVPALLQLVLNAATPADRRETTQTLASVLRRSESSRAGDVVAAYQSASAMPTRIALIEVLGQTSNDEALPVLRAALQDPAPEIARAATLALSDWASPAPMPELLSAARAGSSPVLQVLALRGYLKLLALPAPRTAPEGAALVANAFQLATQAAEKRAALSLLASFPCKQSLDLAEAAVSDPQVAKEAAAAVVRLNSLLKFQ